MMRKNEENKKMFLKKYGMIKHKGSLTGEKQVRNAEILKLKGTVIAEES